MPGPAHEVPLDCEGSTRQYIDPIEELFTSYNDLNASEILVLNEEPSALEFMRHVATNTPFRICGGAADWPARKKWDMQYLKSKLGSELVNVAVTPLGNADSPLVRNDGTKVFVKPWEEDQLFGEFLDYVHEQERSGNGIGEVRYAQTQNDNLRGEYATLFADVQEDIPWARIALQRGPEAINLWIGNSRSVTALHKDPYENIYVQIRGYKHFTLLPPIAQPAINEQFLQQAHYVRSADIAGAFDIKLEDIKDSSAILFPVWDPEVPLTNETRYGRLARPIRVTLAPGDMLYLPALWYHRVSQQGDIEEGLSIAVNYWHDMEYAGAFEPMTQFLRRIADQHG